MDFFTCILEAVEGSIYPGAIGGGVAAFIAILTAVTTFINRSEILKYFERRRADKMVMKEVKSRLKVIDHGLKTKALSSEDASDLLNKCLTCKVDKCDIKKDEDDKGRA